MKIIILTILILSGLSACDVFREKPSAKEAETAIAAWVQNVGLQTQNLPAGFSLAKIVMGDCIWQTAPEGQVCNMQLVSKDIPIIGAISIPVQLRFVKSDGLWKAYVL